MHTQKVRDMHVLETPATKTGNFKALCPNSRPPKTWLCGAMGSTLDF